MVRSTALRAVGDVQASFGEHLLHIAETQSEPDIQPDRMADNFRWKAVTLEGELAHQASLMPVAPPCHPGLVWRKKAAFDPPSAADASGAG